MGFSDTMTYEKRSELRKECSRFIRFSYLADFLAMESLTNIFTYSVNELDDKISVLVANTQSNIIFDLSNKGMGTGVEPYKNN